LKFTLKDPHAFNGLHPLPIPFARFADRAAIRELLVEFVKLRFELRGTFLNGRTRAIFLLPEGTVLVGHKASCSKG
jgi:hypothetical protein